MFLICLLGAVNALGRNSGAGHRFDTDSGMVVLFGLHGKELGIDGLAVSLGFRLCLAFLAKVEV